MKHQNEMTDLILVDQPPVHQQPGAGHVEYWSNLASLGVPIFNFIRREALEGPAKEAGEVDFTSQLHEIRIPKTLFVGRSRDARIPTDLSDETLSSYQHTLPACRVIPFTSSGHMIPDEEQGRSALRLKRFSHP